jgi:hypothetical protein
MKILNWKVSRRLEHPYIKRTWAASQESEVQNNFINQDIILKQFLPYHIPSAVILQGTSIFHATYHVYIVNSADVKKGIYVISIIITAIVRIALPLVARSWSWDG